MTQALLIGTICAGLYGLFLFFRGLIRLHKLEERKMFFSCIALFLLGCLLLGASLFLKLEALNIWIVLPVLIIFFLLLSAGYFLEAYLKGERRRRMDGMQKVIPARPKNWLRDSLVFLSLGLVLWLVGVFLGYGSNETVEVCVLCVSLFLLGKAFTSLWKYRGF